MNEHCTVLRCGTYTIPDDCVAVVHKGEIRVYQRKSRTLAHGDLRCRNCAHRMPNTAIDSSCRPSYVCTMKPKPRHGNGKLYYASRPYDKICEFFDKLD